MKFMVMHRADAVSESEPKPTPELIANVGQLVQGAIENGTLIDGAGLRASVHRVRIGLRGGQRTVRPGPYAGENERISRIAKLLVKSMDEAIEWATRFAQAVGATELEVGLVTEPWDLGVVPKPEGELPLHVLALLKADEASESGRELSREQAALLTRFVDDATRAGVYEGSYSLLPTAKAARIQGPKGARTISDGPFAEARELVGGYMIQKFASKAEAVAFAVKYADVVGAHEVDVLEVA